MADPQHASTIMNNTDFNDADVDIDVVAKISSSASVAAKDAIETSASTTNGSSSESPVIIITDHQDNIHCDAAGPKKKKPKKSNTPNDKNNNNNGKNSKKQQSRVFRPESDRLLDDMLYPLDRSTFFKKHFRKNAVCIQRRPRSLVKEEKRRKKLAGSNRTISDDAAASSDHYGNKAMVKEIISKHLFDLDVRQIFSETSSENVFLWLRPPPPSNDDEMNNNNSSKKTSAKTSSVQSALNSVEIPDPETAYALHRSGSHPAYCRAPPSLEQLLVGNLLRQTGLGGGQYHPPHDPDMVSLGGNTTLGRGEVELFIGAAAASPGSGCAAGTGSSKRVEGSETGANAKSNGGNGSDTPKSKKHTTGWHTDFQENFTIQLSGVKKWTLRRGRVRHPIRATTPHYCREASVVENQLKVARMCCKSNDSSSEKYGFEYNDNNTLGEEQEVYLYPGDVLYFPSGMWHKVEAVEAGVSLNVSLMGTTWASLVCDSLKHLLLGHDERWREVVSFRLPTNGTTSGGEDDGVARLQEMLEKLPKIIEKFTKKEGGAGSLMPPSLCYPQMRNEEVGDEWVEEEEEGGDITESDDEDGSDAGSDASDKDGSGSESMELEIDNGDSDEDEETAWGIVVPLDEFEGPSGWSYDRLSIARPVKNPLASLIPMSEVTAPVTGNTQQKSKGVPKKYILNVNFAGNEMCESHVRVVLETTEHIDLMDWYVDCESQGVDPGKIFCQTNGLEKSSRSLEKHSRLISGTVPPAALFYYGYFSWNDKATDTKTID